MAKKLGLALSGGGSRAAAQLGALKALNDNDIEISAYSGTSAGSMVAVLAADGVDPEIALKEIDSFSIFTMVNLSYSLSGLSNLKKIKKSLSRLLSTENLEDLPVPTLIAATNLNAGKIRIFDKGPIIERVLASSSIPVLFAPQNIDGSNYVDGGMLMNLPAEPLKDYCDKILAFSITPVVERTKGDYNRILDIGLRTFELSVQGNVRTSKEACDLVIEPEELNSFGIFSFDKMDKMFDIGYEAIEKNIDDIKALTKED